MNSSDNEFPQRIARCLRTRPLLKVETHRGPSATGIFLLNEPDKCDPTNMTEILVLPMINGRSLHLHFGAAPLAGKPIEWEIP